MSKYDPSQLRFDLTVSLEKVLNRVEPLNYIFIQEMRIKNEKKIEYSRAKVTMSESFLDSV